MIYILKSHSRFKNTQKKLVETKEENRAFEDWDYRLFYVPSFKMNGGQKKIKRHNFLQGAQ